MIELNGQKYFTKADLNEALKDVPDNAIIWVEGCDCSNAWNGTVTQAQLYPAPTVIELGADTTIEFPEPERIT